MYESTKRLKHAVFFTSMIFVMAAVDAAASLAMRQDSVVFAKQDRLDPEAVEMIDRALASRYMQWGSVGVIVILVLYIVIYRDPQQLKDRFQYESDRHAKEIDTLAHAQERYLDSMASRDSLLREMIQSLQALQKSQQHIIQLLEKGKKN